MSSCIRKVEVRGFSDIRRRSIRTRNYISHSISGDLGVGSCGTDRGLSDGVSIDGDTSSSGIGTISRELSIGESGGTEGDSAEVREYPSGGSERRTRRNIGSHRLEFVRAIGISGSRPSSGSRYIHTILCSGGLIFDQYSISGNRRIPIDGLKT